MAQNYTPKLFVLCPCASFIVTAKDGFVLLLETVAYLILLAMWFLPNAVFPTCDPLVILA